MRLKTISALPWIIVVTAIPVMSSCALKNDVQAAASGCDEFQSGGQAVAALDIDTKVKAFAQASSELTEVGNGIKADVKLACVNIAVDLGETDRWSNDDADSALSNADKTGACDVAASRIDAIMTATVQAGASFALEVSGGQCTIDAEAQASCETACKTNVTCTEATVEVRCPPAELSVQCDAECKAEAVCQGHADREANCMGKCESECQGTCKGELDGTTAGGCTGCARVNVTGPRHPPEEWPTAPVPAKGNAPSPPPLPCATANAHRVATASAGESASSTRWRT